MTELRPPGKPQDRISPGPEGEPSETEKAPQNAAQAVSGVHLVFFSGGMSSFFAALRVKQKVGPENMRLLFTDTLYEDEDLYRFLEEGAEYLGVPLVKIADGRNPWEVFKDVRYLGNSRIDPCSKYLKRELAQKWVKSNYSPEDVVLYLGMNHNEGHRLENSRRYWDPYRVEAPLMEEPYLERHLMMSELDHLGILPPRLYELGFPHNNCGGFCVKAGQAHFRLLLRELPEKYLEAEQKEQEIRDYLGKDVAILRSRAGGTITPVTLKEFRTKELSECDLSDWGGCGCFGDV